MDGFDPTLDSFDLAVSLELPRRARTKPGLEPLEEHGQQRASHAGEVGFAGLEGEPREEGVGCHSEDLSLEGDREGEAAVVLPLPGRLLQLGLGGPRRLEEVGPSTGAAA